MVYNNKGLFLLLHIHCGWLQLCLVSLHSRTSADEAVTACSAYDRKEAGRETTIHVLALKTSV